MELRRDPAGARPAGIGRSRLARAVTWPPTAAEVTHACHKDTVFPARAVRKAPSFNWVKKDSGRARGFTFFMTAPIH